MGWPTRLREREQAGFMRRTSGRTQGNSLKSEQGRFRLDIRKNFFSSGTAWLSIGMGSREVVESPSLEVFKRHVVVAVRDVV